MPLSTEQGRLICPERCVSLLNICNPIQSINSPKWNLSYDQIYWNINNRMNTKLELIQHFIISIANAPQIPQYSTKDFKSMISKETQYKTYEAFAISTVPADGLAPSGARPSAGTVMTKFVSHEYILEGLIIWVVCVSVCVLSMVSCVPIGSAYQLARDPSDRLGGEVNQSNHLSAL